MKKLKKQVKNFIMDIKSATPKIYKWLMGILVGLAGMAVTISLAFDSLPQTLQSMIPDTVLKVLAGLALLGAVLAKKQNIKPNDKQITSE